MKEGMTRFKWLLVAKQNGSGVRTETGWSTTGRADLEEGGGGWIYPIILHKCETFQRLNKNTF